jgi:hypothetical protein
MVLMVMMMMVPMVMVSAPLSQPSSREYCSLFEA